METRVTSQPTLSRRPREMALSATREDVRRLRAHGALVIEVLPREDYERRHIAGAINLPLPELNEETAARLDRRRAIVLYCNDFQCDLSARAAARLETMDFANVYNYEGGKLDWLASGLPTEGSAAEEPTIGDFAHRDAPTCRLDERLADLTQRMSEGWNWCAVINQDLVVLGRVRRRAIEEHPHASVRQAMENGPPTYRPSMLASELRELMQAGGYDSAFVTDSDGHFIGLVNRLDLETARA